MFFQEGSWCFKNKNRKCTSMQLALELHTTLYVLTANLTYEDSMTFGFLYCVSQ